MKLTNKVISELTEKHHFKIYKRYPIALAKGRGARVWDVEGNEYIDALAGIAVNSVGHCHPDVVKAIRQQAEKSIHISNLYYSETQAKLAAKLVEISGLDRVFFCNSGAESIESAVKTARSYANKLGKKGDVISMDNCFHGRTLGTIAMGKEKYRKGFEPMPPGYKRLPFNDLDAMKKEVNSDTVAVVIEPVQGEGGIHTASDKFLQGVRELCDKHNALLIFDEIQCGIARTGKMFAWMHSGVKPDLLCIAKALGGGFPIGATIATEKAAAGLDYGVHGTTYGGNPLACAAALAALKVIEDENLCSRAAELGDYMMKEIRERTLGWNSVKEVRGVGLMIGVDLSFNGANVVNKMLDFGVLSNCASGSVMRIVPPLVATKDEIDTIIRVLLDSIKFCSNRSQQEIELDKKEQI